MFSSYLGRIWFSLCVFCCIYSNNALIAQCPDCESLTYTFDFNANPSVPCSDNTLEASDFADIFSNCTTDPPISAINILDASGASLGNTISHSHIDQPNLQYEISFSDATPVCIGEFSVIDDTPPTLHLVTSRTVALVDGQAVISATVFDNHSVDQCGRDIYFRIRRATTNQNCLTSGNPQNLFYENLRICCDDLGDSPLTLILRVYDRDPGSDPVPLNVGHFSEAMVTLHIQNKLGPSYTCPRDITVGCEEYLPRATNFTGDLIFSNSCGLDHVRIVDEDLRDGCSSGTVQREFHVFDANGNITICTQEITVENDDPFDGTNSLHLSFPTDTVIMSCSSFDVSPDELGFPTLRDDKCDMISPTYRDVEFNFQNQSCYHIHREWAFIDWCLFDSDADNLYDESNGYYTHTQVIEIKDTISPIVNNSDRILLPGVFPCSGEGISLPNLDIDHSCGDEGQVVADIDINFDGVFDYFNVNESDINNLLVPGNHLIHYEIDDRCKNTTLFERIVHIVPKHDPLYFKNLSVVLQQMGSQVMVQISANQFILNDYSDSCYPLVRYTFDASGRQEIITLDCDDIPSTTLQIWGWDALGNSIMGEVVVNVQDNQNLCNRIIENDEIRELDDMGNTSAHRENNMPIIEVEISKEEEIFLLKYSLLSPIEFAKLELQLDYLGSVINLEDIIELRGDISLDITESANGVKISSKNLSNDLIEGELFSLVLSSSSNAVNEALLDVKGSNQNFVVNHEKQVPVDIQLRRKQSVQSSTTRNIPNPFSGQTVIEFDLVDSENVLFEVRNANGQQVFHTRINASIGRNQYVFKPEQSLVPGVYFYSIVTRHKLLSNRMVIE